MCFTKSKLLLISSRICFFKREKKCKKFWRKKLTRREEDLKKFISILTWINILRNFSHGWRSDLKLFKVQLNPLSWFTLWEGLYSSSLIVKMSMPFTWWNWLIFSEKLATMCSRWIDCSKSANSLAIKLSILSWSMLNTLLKQKMLMKLINILCQSMILSKRNVTICIKLQEYIGCQQEFMKKQFY